MKTFNFLVVAALALLAGQVAAQQTVEDRKAVMDAQIELVRKQKELQEALRALGGAQALGMPVVVSVTIGNQRVARLQLPNGIVGHYREGEAIRPGMVVTSIAPKQVFVAVSNGRKATAVPLDFAGPTLLGQSSQGTQPSVPDALLPQAPQVVVPAVEPIEVIPATKPAVAAPAAAAPAVVAKAGK